MPNKDRVSFRETRICLHCGCEFTAKKSTHVYCSFKCYRRLTLKPKRYCVQCDAELPSSKLKYCNHQCESIYTNNKRVHYYPKNVSTLTIGAISELITSIDLFSKGFSVFRALSPNAPCDLIAMKDGQLLRIEVRTSNGTFKNLSSHIKDTDCADYWAFVKKNDVQYYPRGL